MEDTTTITNEIVKNNVEETTIEATWEVDNMVRRAETLKLDELKLSNRARFQIKKSGMTLDDLVLTGRKIATDCTTRFEPAEKEPKWKQELTSALYEAGFIRDDLNVGVCRIWLLYTVILTYTSSFPEFIKYNSFTNQDYEQLATVSDEDLRKVEEVLSSLAPMERATIERRFGLHSIKLYDLEEIGRELRITRERVRQHEAKALRKLKHPSCLCKLPALFGFIPPTRPTMIATTNINALS